MESWTDIINYEGIYKISNYGRVFSITSGKILKPIKSSTGYYHVSLYKSQSVKSFNIHALVANAFLPNTDESLEINHKDGDKSNNSVDNLEWVTKSENQKHAIVHNLRVSSPMLGMTGAKNPRSKTILQYDLSGVFIKEWIGISEAARGTNQSFEKISLCLRGKAKTAGKSIWKYKDGNNIPDKIDVPIFKCQTAKTWKQRNRRKMHKIKQLTKHGVTIRIWDNYEQIVNETHYDVGNIYKAIQGKLKSAYGFLWEYAD